MTFKSATDITVLCHLLLLFGLGVSGAFSGIASDVIYLGAFILPTVLGLYLGKRVGVGIIKPGISKQQIKLFVPIVFPSVLLIMGISALTSLILTWAGAQNSVTVYPTFFENLIRHVILPALLEEAIFRYLPMSLFAAENRRACILISSLCFALIHCNLFQMPYAFVAGVIFMGANIIFESPLPSLILHVVNNLISVISLYYGKDLLVILICAALSLVSVVLIILKRESYKVKIKHFFADKSKYKLSYSLLLIIIPTLIMSILNLLG